MRVYWLGLLVVSIVLSGCGSTPKPVQSPASIQAQIKHRNALQAIRDGRIESASLEWRAAVLAYQSIDDWQGQGMARLGLAQAQMRLQHKKEAEQTLQPMLQPNLSLETFTQTQQSQAAFQMAQLVLPRDLALAQTYLAQSKASCATPCFLQVQYANLSAKMALQAGDLNQAKAFAQAVLLMEPATNAAELAFAQRLLAEVAMQESRYPAAKILLMQAITLDRQSAEPLWLLDDYRLLLKIAQQSNDAALQTDAQQHLVSLCAALQCVP